MTKDQKKIIMSLENQYHSDKKKSERMRKVSIVLSRDRSKGPVKKPTSIKALWVPVRLQQLRKAMMAPIESSED